MIPYWLKWLEKQKQDKHEALLTQLKALEKKKNVVSDHLHNLSLYLYDKKINDAEYWHSVKNILGDKTEKQYFAQINHQIARTRKQLEKAETEHHLVYHHKLHIGFALVMLILLSLTFFYNIPTPTAFVTYIESQDLVLELNETFNESTTYPLDLDELLSLKVSGSILGDGSVRIYLQKDNAKLLVYNRARVEKKAVSEPKEPINLITGNVAAEQDVLTEDEEKTLSEDIIDVNIESSSSRSSNITNKNFTTTIPNETIGEIINESFEQNITVVNETLNESIEETLNITINETANVTENITINETINITENITINETINITINETFNVTENITINETVNITENITEEINLTEINITENITSYDFSGECVETCILDNISKVSLLIELDGAILLLDKIIFTTAVKNRPPTQFEEIPDISFYGKHTLNMRDYFADHDEDDLSYELNDIPEVDYFVENDKLTLLSGTEGIYTAFIIVSDGKDSTISNEFNLLVGNVTINETTNITENITINETINITANITNVTELLEQELIQFPARVDEPVRWAKRFAVLNEENETELNISFAIPEVAEILEVKEYEKDDKIPLEKVIKHPKFAMEEEYYFKEKFKKLEKKKYQILYHTPAPTKEETIVNAYKKIIKVSGILDYQDVAVSTQITEAAKESIRVYWRRDNGRTLFPNITYYDTNNNDLIDLIEWNVPHLSEQTFEVEIIKVIKEEKDFVPVGLQKWQDANDKTKFKAQIGGAIANYQRDDGVWEAIRNEWIDQGDVIVSDKDILKVEVRKDGQSTINLIWDGTTYTVKQRLKDLVFVNKKTKKSSKITGIGSLNFGDPIINGNVVRWENVVDGVDVEIVKDNGQVFYRLVYNPEFLLKTVSAHNLKSESEKQDIVLGNVMEVELINVDNPDFEGDVNERILKNFKAKPGRGNYQFKIRRQELQYEGGDNFEEDRPTPIVQNWKKENGRIYLTEQIEMNKIKEIHQKNPSISILHNSETVIDGTTDVQDTYISSSAPNANYGGTTVFYAHTTLHGLIRVKNVNTNLGGDATITACTLSLYTANGVFNADIPAIRVFKPWIEGSGTGSGSGANWYYWDSTNVKDWTTDGADSADDAGSDNSGDGTGADRKATAEDTTTVTGTNAWFNWSISTSLAQGWYDGTINEEGVYMAPPSGSNWASFVSTEGASNQPYWTFEYTIDYCPVSGNWEIMNDTNCTGGSINAKNLILHKNATLNLTNVTLRIDGFAEINGTLIISNSQATIWQNGNLTINGNYTLDNSTLRMNGSNSGDLMINITETGDFNGTNGCNITTGETAAAYFGIYGTDGGEVNIQDCYLSNMGHGSDPSNSGIYIAMSDAIIYNNTMDNIYQISINENKANLSNNRITNQRFEISSSNSNYHRILYNDIRGPSATRGIDLLSSDNSNISNNNITTQGEALLLNESQHNNFKSNLFNSTDDHAIYFFADNEFNNNFTDCTLVSGAGADDYDIQHDSTATDNLYNIFRNCSFNQTDVNVTDGEIRVQWYLIVNVSDVNENPISGATVAVFSDNQSENHSVTTNSNGRTPRINVTEYSQGSLQVYPTNVTYFTNYTINTTTSDGHSESNYINITDNYILNVTIDINPPSVTWEDPTPDDGLTVNQTWVALNTTITDNERISAFLDWNYSVIGYWSFEYYDASLVYDNSSAQNNLTYQDDMSQGNITPCIYGKGIEFDGVSDYLSLDNPINITDNTTFMIWIYADSLAQAGNMFLGSLDLDNYVAIMNNGDLQLQDNESQNKIWNGFSGTTGVWYHVAVRKNRTHWEAFKDGVSLGTQPDTGWGDDHLFISVIGQGYTSNLYEWDGKVDEFRVFNRWLTDVEINASYNNTAYALYHNFTELSYDTYYYSAYVIDSVGNFNITDLRTVTTANSPPTTPTPEINSTDGTNRTNQDLNCIDDISDNEGNTLDVQVNWYKNDTFIETVYYNNSYASGTHFNTTLGSNYTAIEDIWVCELRLDDGENLSNFGNSSELTIVKVNFPPLLTNVTANETSVTEGEKITFTGYWTDSNTNQNHMLLVTNDSTFSDCNYPEQSGCLAYSSPDSTSPTTAEYTSQGGDGTVNWYAQICDDDNVCDKYVYEANTFSMDTNLSDVDASWYGENAADELGYAVTYAGDVNDDGFDDILISAPRNDEGASGAGQVYLFFGAKAGWQMDQNITSANASWVGENTGDQLGYEADSVGDFNGDGIDDFVLHAPYAEGVGDPGHVGVNYLFYGHNDTWSMDVDASNANVSFVGENEYDYAGWKLAGVGDVNNDGYDDIVIGAWANDQGGTWAGKVYLVLGSSGSYGTYLNLSTFNASWVGENAGDDIGWSVEAAGDVNDDGFDDFLMGAPGYAAGNKGHTYLIFGHGGSWQTDVNVSDLRNASFIGEAGSDIAGLWVSEAGDVNNDGYYDILIGARNSDDGGSNAGEAYLIFGTDDWGMNTSLNNANASWIGENVSDQAGFMVSKAGRVDSDSFDDFLVYSHANAEHGVNTTQTYLIFGHNGTWGTDVNLSSANASWHGENVHDMNVGEYDWNWRRGRFVSYAGDVNGDGYGDLLIGMPWNDEGAGNAGQAYLILSSTIVVENGTFTVSDNVAPDLSNVTANETSVISGEKINFTGYWTDANSDQYHMLLVTNDSTFANCNYTEQSGCLAYSTPDVASPTDALYTTQAGDGTINWYAQVCDAEDACDKYVYEANTFAMDTNLSDVDASWYGENSGDGGGWSVTTAGDVNDDGYGDILISSYRNDEGNSDAGQVYLIFGEESGWQMDQNVSTANASWLGEGFSDWFGYDVDSVGDFNGDGFDDFIAGAIYAEGTGDPTWVGVNYLFYGHNGSWSMDVDASNANVSFVGEMEYDFAGWKLAGVGDVNNDGYDDIVIGSFYNDQGGDSAGKVYLVLGSSGSYGSYINLSTFNASWVGEWPSDKIGWSVEAAGDVNNDGYDDFLMGAPTYDAGNKGHTYLIFGHGGSWQTDVNVSNLHNASFMGEANSDNAGFSVSGVGDLNNDGYDDILIGAVVSDDGGNNAGEVHVIFGTDDWGMNTSLESANASFVGENASDWLGFALAKAGKVNNDGFDDFLVYSFRNSEHAANTSQTYLILGHNSTWGNNTNISNANASWHGEEVNDVNLYQYDAYWQFGRYVSQAVDINGDGYSELLIGMPWNDEASEDAGQAYLILSAVYAIENGTFTVTDDPCNPYGDWTVQTDIDCSSTSISINNLRVLRNSTLNLNNVTLRIDGFAEINGTFVASNSKSTIWMNDNLTVWGNYTLDNSTLRMNGTTSGEVHINVTGTGDFNGTNGCNITNGETAAAYFGMVGYAGGEINIQNCYLSNMGDSSEEHRKGFNTEMDNVIFYNNTVDNIYRIEFEADKNNFSHNKITNLRYWVGFVGSYRSKVHYNDIRSSSTVFGLVQSYNGWDNISYNNVTTNSSALTAKNTAHNRFWNNLFNSTNRHAVWYQDGDDYNNNFTDCTLDSGGGHNENAIQVDSIAADNLYMIFKNCTLNSTDPFNRSLVNVTNGEIRVQWNLIVNVVDAHERPLSGINIGVYSDNKSENHSVTTLSTGKTPRINVTEYSQGYSQIYPSNVTFFTNYTVNITSNNFDNKSVSINITDNYGLSVTLDKATDICNPGTNAEWIINKTVSCTDVSATVTNWNVTEFGSLTLINGTVRSDETVVHGNLTIINATGTIYQNGNLTVNGTYILDFSHLVMNGTTDGYAGINVTSGGNFIAYNDSNISNGDVAAANYFFVVNEGGNLTLEDTYLANAGWTRGKAQSGLYVNATAVRIENCTFDDNYISIYMDTNSDGSNISDNNITGRAAVSPYAILLNESDSNNISNNKIWGMTISSNNWVKALYLETSDSNTIDRNLIVDIGGGTASEYAMGLALNKSLNNEITYNNITDIGGTNAGIGVGLAIFESNNTLIKNNNVSDGNGGTCHGMFLQSSSHNQIKDNLVMDNEDEGIYFDKNDNSNITNNTILRNAEEGFYVKDSSHSKIDNNTISSNSDDGLEFIGTSLTKDNNVTNNVLRLNINDGIKTAAGVNNESLIADNYLNENDNAIRVGGQDSILERNIINGSTTSGIVLVDSTRGVKAIDCYIDNSTDQDIYMGSASCQDSNLELINTSFSKDNITFNGDTNCNLTVKWYLIVNVTNSSIGPLQDVNVSTFSDNKEENFTYLTASNGLTVNINITEFIQNASPINATNRQYFTNITVNSSKVNYQNDSRQLNISDTNSTVLHIILYGAPPHDPTVSLVSVDGSNTTNSDLNCSAVITDPLGKNIDVTTQWYKNESLQATFYFNNSYANGTLFNDTLDSSNLSDEDIWKCEMRLYNGDTYSNWVNSSNVTIYYNYAPNLLNVTANETAVIVGEVINFTAYWTDLNPNQNHILLITNDSTFTDCNYTEQSGCLAYSSNDTTSPTDALYTVQVGDGKIVWYAQVCDAGYACDYEVFELRTFSMDMNVSLANASWFGESADDRAGWSVASAGDVNNDGYDDIIIGAHNSNETGMRKGQAYLIFGNEKGWQMDVNISNANASWIGESNVNYAGWGVSSAGDFNDDSFDDILIGAHWHSTVSGCIEGITYLILGHNSTWSNDVSLSNANASYYGECLDGLYDQTGRKIDSVGDFDGDGFDDFIIGTRYNDEGGSDAGQVYLILGMGSGWQFDFNLSYANASWIAENTNDWLAHSVSGAGDFNGDGFDDFIVGAGGNDEGGIGGRGQAYVVFGDDSSWSNDENFSNVNVSFLGEFWSDYAGISVSGAGDVNNDGYDDILIGASHSDDGGTDAGEVYLVFGNVDAWAMDTVLTSANASWVGENASDWAGYYVSGAGDVNNDMFDDILITAIFNSEYGQNTTQTYLIFGHNGTWGTDVNLSTANASWVGENAGDYMYDQNGGTKGRIVRDAGDVNKDGAGDFLIGMPFNDEGGIQSGQAYLILSSNFIIANGSFHVNHVPDDPSPYLTTVDKKNETDSDLNCSATISDHDGDNLNVTVNWYQNDSLFLTDYYNNSYSNNSLFEANLSSSLTFTDDEWICELRLDDGNNLSNWANSTAMTVLEVNHVPVLTNCTANESFVNAGEVINFTAYWTDPNPGQNQRLLISTDSTFANCNYTQQAGCLAYSSADTTSPTDALYTTQASDETINWYAQICDDKNTCDKRIYDVNTFSMDTNLSDVDASWYGENAADELGYAVTYAGDVNDDGFDDILISAPRNDEGASGAGQVYLFFGEEAGWQMDQNITSANASWVGENTGDQLGFEADSVGDFNGDGIDDFVLHAPYAEGAGDPTWVGVNYLFYGHNDTWSMDVDASNANVSFVGENEYDYAGWKLAGVGDVNNDGYDDIVIGAWANNQAGWNNGGKVYLVLGSSGSYGSYLNLSTFNASWIGEWDADELGWSVEAAGDFNNDGFDDFLMSSPAYDAFNNGHAYLVFGHDGVWQTDVNVSNLHNASFIGEANSDNAGFWVSGAGDVNNDGYDDILIGARGSDDGGSNAGEAYLVFGTDDWGMNTSLNNANASWYGENVSDWAGFIVSKAGRVNNDNFDDFLVYSHANCEHGVNTTQTYLIFGHNGTWGTDVNLSTANASWHGENVHDMNVGEYAYTWRRGRHVNYAGDINGDGYSDLLIGMPWNDEASSNAGQAYLILSAVSVIENGTFTVNDAPTNPSPYLTTVDKSNRTDSDLNCSSTITDPNSDNLNVTIQWYVNDTLRATQYYNNSYASGTLFNATLDKSNTSTNDIWVCEMRLDDGNAFSSWVNSTAMIVINNTLPTVPTLTSPTNDNTTYHNRTPFFDWSDSTDADNDAITYEINVTCNTACRGGGFNHTPISGSNYTSQSELCTVDEDGGPNLYNWSVRACDSYGCSNYSASWNFSIEPYVSIILYNGTVDFGELRNTEINDTTNNVPNPIVFENAGNVVCDMINVTSNESLWEDASAGLGTNYTQIKADNTSEARSFNWTGSLFNWTNLTSTNQSIIASLNYSDSSDTAELDIRIEVPLDEPKGDKETFIIFWYEQSP